MAPERTPSPDCAWLHSGCKGCPHQEPGAALNGGTLTGLVNNAGIAVPGLVLELAADEIGHQMDVNVIGPIIATQAFGPLLGSDPLLKGVPYHLTPDPMRHLITGVLPKRMVDRIIARRLGLMPPA